MAIKQSKFKKSIQTLNIHRPKTWRKYYLNSENPIWNITQGMNILRKHTQIIQAHRNFGGNTQWKGSNIFGIRIKYFSYLGTVCCSPWLCPGRGRGAVEVEVEEPRSGREGSCWVGLTQYNQSTSCWSLNLLNLLRVNGGFVSPKRFPVSEEKLSLSRKTGW